MGGSRFGRRLTTSRTWRSIASVLVDAVVVIAAFYVATYLRFVDAPGNAGSIWERLPFVLIPIAAAYLVSNHVWSLNRRVWKYASGLEVLMIFTSVGLTTMLLLAVDVLVGAFSAARLVPIG